MDRLRRLAPLLLLALALAACGGGGEDGDAPPPRGPASERHGPEAVAHVRAVELLRARLIAVRDLAEAGRHDVARAQLADGRSRWERLAPAVGARDAVLAREVGVAFDRVERQLARRAPFEEVRAPLAPLWTQLLDGVAGTLVPRAARNDPGLRAAVLLDLLDALAAEQGRARAMPGDAGLGARALTWGVLVRSRALARGVLGSLGPARNAVIEGLQHVQELFPEGALTRAAAPPERLRERLDPVRAALRERFGLG